MDLATVAGEYCFLRNMPNGDYTLMLVMGDRETRLLSHVVPMKVAIVGWAAQRPVATFRLFGACFRTVLRIWTLRKTPRNHAPPCLFERYSAWLRHSDFCSRRGVGLCHLARGSRRQLFCPIAYPSIPAAANTAGASCGCHHQGRINTKSDKELMLPLAKTRVVDAVVRRAVRIVRTPWIGSSASTVRQVYVDWNESSHTPDTFKARSACLTVGSKHHPPAGNVRQIITERSISQSLALILFCKQRWTFICTDTSSATTNDASGKNTVQEMIECDPRSATIAHHTRGRSLCGPTTNITQRAVGHRGAHGSVLSKLSTTCPHQAFLQQRYFVGNWKPIHSPTSVSSSNSATPSALCATAGSFPHPWSNRQTKSRRPGLTQELRTDCGLVDLSAARRQNWGSPDASVSRVNRGHWSVQVPQKESDRAKSHEMMHDE